MMFGNTSRLLLAVAILGVLASLASVQPVMASSKTGNFILGLAAGAILGAALSNHDNDCGQSYCAPPPPTCYVPPPVYCAPPPVYYAPPPVYVAPPPVYYYQPAPRQVYVESYSPCRPRYYYAPRPRCW